MCTFCEKESVKNVLTDYERNINGKKIIVKNVPALYCETCGEYYFSNETITQIREKITRAKNITEYVEIYDFNTESGKELLVLAKV